MAASNNLEKNVAQHYCYTAAWLLRWLELLADEPFEDVVYYEYRTSKPAEFSDEEYESFINVIYNSPEDVSI